MTAIVGAVAATPLPRTKNCARLMPVPLRDVPEWNARVARWMAA